MAKCGREINPAGRELHNGNGKLSDTMQSLEKVAIDNNNTTIFAHTFKWKVKDGTSIDFWHDNWHGSGIISEQFSVLYNLSKEKHCTVQEMKRKGRNAWNNDRILWNSHLNEQERTEVNRLNQLVESVNLVKGDDILSGGPFEDNFDTSICYRTLVEERGLVGPWKLIWKLKIPSRSKLFTHNVFPE